VIGPRTPATLQHTGTATHSAAGPRSGRTHSSSLAALPPAWPKSGGPVPPAPMESVDRWPLASIAVQIPGGRLSVVTAVRRRDRGRLPPFRGADAAAGPRLSGRGTGSPASGPSLENSVGAIGMVPRAPRYVRGRRRGRALVAPPNVTILCPFGGRARGVAPLRRGTSLARR
jgi:hypothetical protein